MAVRATEKATGHTDATLHAHRFLLRAGLAIGNVFAWLFVFEYFALLSDSVVRAFAATLLMYALSQSITIFMTPLAAAYLRQRGTKRAIISAVILAATAFIALGATLEGYFTAAPVPWGIGMFAVLLGAYRALYFIPYELNRVATETKQKPSRFLYEILLALIPAFAGATLIMETYAPLRLLFGAAALAGLSVLPLLVFANIRERFSYHYTEVFRELFSPRNQNLVRLAFLEGVQGAALFLFWPLTVFLIVGWSYATLGVIFSVTLLLVLLVRTLHRASFARYSTPVQVTFAVSGWVARLAAGTPIGIVIADSYAHSTHAPRGTLSDPFVLEQAADSGSFIDEHTALKEMALALGRIALCILAYALAFLVPLVVALGLVIGLAALSAGASVVLARTPKLSSAPY